MNIKAIPTYRNRLKLRKSHLQETFFVFFTQWTFLLNVFNNYFTNVLPHFRCFDEVYYMYDINHNKILFIYTQPPIHPCLSCTAMYSIFSPKCNTILITLDKKKLNKTRVFHLNSKAIYQIIRNEVWLLFWRTVNQLYFWKYIIIIH